MCRPRSNCRTAESRHLVPQFDRNQIAVARIDVTTTRFLSGGYSGFERRQTGKLYDGKWPLCGAQHNVGNRNFTYALQ